VSKRHDATPQNGTDPGDAITWIVLGLCVLYLVAVALQAAH
jgi:hypothetical protein